MRLLTTGQLWLKAQRQQSRMTLAQYRACLSTLVTQQQRLGGQVLLIAPFSRKHLDARASGQSGARGRGPQRVYRDALAQVAEQTGSAALNLTDTTWAGTTPTDTLLLDLVHPSATGHRLIAAQLQQTLAASGILPAK